VVNHSEQKIDLDPTHLIPNQLHYLNLMADYPTALTKPQANSTARQRRLISMLYKTNLIPLTTSNEANTRFPQNNSTNPKRFFIRHQSRPIANAYFYYYFYVFLF